MKLTEKVTNAQVKNILAKLNAGKTITRREQAQIEAFERGQSAPKTTREWAAHYKVSHVTIINWGKAGAPLNGTVEEMDAWRASKEKQEPTKYSDAKLQKTLLECKKIELVVAQLEGELISKAAVREANTMIAATLAAELQNLVSDCVSLLDGLQGAQIREKMEPRVNLLIERTNERLANIKSGIRGMD
jgi:hypothetical protein